ANNAGVKVVRTPGSYAYSGGGTMVLQQLVTDVTSLSYQAAAALRVLTPLGMTASNFEQPPSETGAGNIAHAHGPDGQACSAASTFDHRWAGRNSPTTDRVSDGEAGGGRRRAGSLRQQRRPYQPLRREPWLPRRVWAPLECRKSPGGDDQWRQRRTGLVHKSLVERALADEQ